MKPKILTTMPGYTAGDFRADTLAGVSVAMVALPLSLAIAIASGATPDKGLVTAIVAGFLISLLGGSRVQIGGPTGAFIVVVAGVIDAHGYAGLVTATFMAGLILLAAGFARIGGLVRHVPEPVINGFTAGIALIIAGSQLTDFLGIRLEQAPADFLPRMAAIWAARDQIELPALAIGAVTIAVIVLLRRTAPRVPGFIVAVGLTSAAAALMAPSTDTIVSRFGDLPRSLPVPSLPALSPALMVELLPSALIIAFLAGIESLLSAMVADRMISGAHRSNAEILAQGTANLASSLFGGLPATGAIARTATNVRAGGRTPVAGLVHALSIWAMILVAAPLAGRMAMPALAGLLMLTAWNMAEVWRWKAWLTTGRVSDRVLLVLTMLLTVLTNLTLAIGVGVALGLALRLNRRNVPEAPWTPPER